SSPKLLLADEPTTALDVTIQDQILKLILRLRRELAMSVVLVTHDLGVIAQTCDRLAVMYAGRVVETGPVTEIFRRPRHAYTLPPTRALSAAGRGAGLSPPAPPSLPRPPAPPLRPAAGLRLAPPLPFRDRCLPPGAPAVGRSRAGAPFGLHPP